MTKREVPSLFCIQTVMRNQLTNPSGLCSQMTRNHINNSISPLIQSYLLRNIDKCTITTKNDQEYYLIPVCSSISDFARKAGLNWITSIKYILELERSGIMYDGTVAFPVLINNVVPFYNIHPLLTVDNISITAHRKIDKRIKSDRLYNIDGTRKIAKLRGPMPIKENGLKYNIKKKEQ